MARMDTEFMKAIRQFRLHYITSLWNSTLSLLQTDRGIYGLVYLNKVYEKCITLVGNSAILNPMNKHDK